MTEDEKLLAEYLSGSGAPLTKADRERIARAADEGLIPRICLVPRRDRRT